MLGAGAQVEPISLSLSLSLSLTHTHTHTGREWSCSSGLTSGPREGALARARVGESRWRSARGCSLREPRRAWRCGRRPQIHARARRFSTQIDHLGGDAFEWDWLGAIKLAAHMARDKLDSNWRPTGAAQADAAHHRAHSLVNSHLADRLSSRRSCATQFRSPAHTTFAHRVGRQLNSWRFGAPLEPRVDKMKLGEYFQ